MGDKIWDFLEIFFFTMSRQPGLNGWNLVRLGFPEDGPTVEQNYWTMKAFEIAEGEYYLYQADRKKDEERMATPKPNTKT